MNIFVRTIALAAASLLLAAQSADAAGPRPELLSGANRGWLASPNGVDGWIPAYGPYPNPVTMPNPFLNEFGIHADLMWYWPGPGAPDAGSPPSTAYFRHQLYLESEDGKKPQYVALMAADDEMTLIVNGITVDTYRLADNMMPNGQPAAVAVDMTEALRIGNNQIDIRATDKGIYHWVFFDSYNIFRPMTALVPRAPGQISLIGDKDDFHPDDLADTTPKSQHVLDLQDKLLPTPAIDLDQPAVNQSVGLTHDVSVPEGATNITSATVKLHIRMTGDIVDNDVLLFNQSMITDEGLSTRVIALHDLLGFPPQAGATYDLIWNLAKTPLRNVASPIVTGQADQVVNLLPMLVSDKRVDVLLADGTMVDYSELSVTYISGSSAPGDLNNDGVVDRADVSILLLGLNTLASGPNDPRDFDRDGRITALDVRKLVARCSHPLCN